MGNQLCCDTSDYNSGDNHHASSDNPCSGVANSGNINTSQHQQTNQASQTNKTTENKTATSNKITLGPKSIISSTIVTVLSEHFVVDVPAIESNLLLNDTKITLRNLQLRPQTMLMPLSGAGCMIRITITGALEEVSLRWAWCMGGDVAGWAKDMTLMIRGAKFCAQLEHMQSQHASFFVEDEFPWGSSGFVNKQLKMAFDMLTLQVVDFELCVELPSGAGVNEISGLKSREKRSLVIVGKEVDLLSHGRCNDKNEPIAAAGELMKLRQTIHFRSFSSNIKIEEHEETTIIPLIEPFSCSARVARVGERFGGFIDGLEILGVVRNKIDESSDGAKDDEDIKSDVALHIGNVQMETLAQLGVMILAVMESDKDASSTKDNRDEIESVEIIGNGTPFMIRSTTNERIDIQKLQKLSSSYLFDDTIFFIHDMQIRYKADGMACSIKVSKMGLDSMVGGQAEASQIEIKMRPTMQIRFGAIQKLHIPNMVLLPKPIKNVELTYEGGTLSARLNAVDVIIFSMENETFSSTGKSMASTCPASSMTNLITAPHLPCAIAFEIRSIQIKHAAYGPVMMFTNLKLYGFPNVIDKSVDIAIQFANFKNHLVELTHVNMRASIPYGVDNCINDFNFSMESATIMSGHTTKKRAEAYRKKHAKDAVKQHAKAGFPSFLIKMPYAEIADAKVLISFRVTKGMKMKQTPLTIKAFSGSAETILKDVMKYYVKVCLTRVPDFVSNAEVLGLNM